MVLEFNQQAKEERIKCVRENRSDKMLRAGNEALKCGKETLENSVSEVIKGENSDINCEECVRHNHKE